MNATASRALLLLFGVILALQAPAAFAQPAPERGGSAASQQPDGQRDFDFEFGSYSRASSPFVWSGRHGCFVIQRLNLSRGKFMPLSFLRSAVNPCLEKDACYSDLAPVLLS